MPRFDYDENDPILAVLIAASKLDRENLEREGERSPGASDDRLRRELDGAALALSEALAALPPGLATALLVKSGGAGAFFEIIGANSGKVIGVTTDPLSVLAEETHARFNRIRLARFLAYSDNPWTEPSPDFDSPEASHPPPRR